MNPQFNRWSWKIVQHWILRPQMLWNQKQGALHVSGSHTIRWKGSWSFSLGKRHAKGKDRSGRNKNILQVNFNSWCEKQSSWAAQAIRTPRWRDATESILSWGRKVDNQQNRNSQGSFSLLKLGKSRPRIKYCEYKLTCLLILYNFATTQIFL